MIETTTPTPVSSMRFVRRPAIGEMIIVHDKTPWKARVRDYHECDDSCVRVTKAYTTKEWIVPWRHCSPIMVATGSIRVRLVGQSTLEDIQG